VKGSSKRIWALIVQELFITRRSLEIFFDIFFFPLMHVILFGLITIFVAQIKEASSAQYLIMGILLWEIVTIAQYNVTVSSLWSVWSRNLTNIFTAPITVAEYLGAHIAAAAIRTLAVVAFLSLGAWLFFGFNLLQVGILNLALFCFNLIFFACWLGVILLGLIFRFGARIQAISWGTIFLFQPLTAAFFPVSVLPGFIQAISYALPPTYVFEAARQALDNSVINWRYTLTALVLNIAYSLLAAVLFHRLFKQAKITGRFARNES
jgi:ABC-2 type transport system permease protein